MSRLLINEPPLMVLPQLAVHIGLNEAILLQQVHYWTRECRNVVDGKSWVYNSIEKWREQFPFWSAATIRRTIDSLVEKGLLLKQKLSVNKLDATLWYAIDLEKLDALNEQIDLLKMSKPVAQDEHMSFAQDEQTPNKNRDYTETTSESGCAAHAGSPAVPHCPVDRVIEAYHELMPLNPRVKVLNAKRRKAIAARWREAAQLSCRPFGYTTVEAGMEAWCRFFRVCAESEFLTGRAKPQAGRQTFLADIDFLTSPDGFTRCLENKYHREAS